MLPFSSVPRGNLLLSLMDLSLKRLKRRFLNLGSPDAGGPVPLLLPQSLRKRIPSMQSPG
eukprot:3629276-Pleurochrysis_carterae.AAC.1